MEGPLAIIRVYRNVALAPPGDKRTFRSGSGFSRTCELGAHLLHHLPHRGNVARRTGFNPGLETLRGLFHVGEELPVRETFPPLRDDRLDAIPDPVELSARFKE
jgi:hypothetical protein